MLVGDAAEPLAALGAVGRCAGDLAAPMPRDPVAPRAERDRLAVRWLGAGPVCSVVRWVRPGARRAVAARARGRGAPLAHEPVEIGSAPVGLPLHGKPFYASGMALRYVQSLVDLAALCTRCRERPRVPKQRWCRACFNAYMRAYRARRKAAAKAAS